MMRFTSKWELLSQSVHSIVPSSICRGHPISYISRYELNPICLNGQVCELLKTDYGKEFWKHNLKPRSSPQHLQSREGSRGLKWPGHSAPRPWPGPPAVTDAAWSDDRRSFGPGPEERPLGLLWLEKGSGRKSRPLQSCGMNAMEQSGPAVT